MEEGRREKERRERNGREREGMRCWLGWVRYIAFAMIAKLTKILSLKLYCKEGDQGQFGKTLSQSHFTTNSLGPRLVDSKANLVP